MKTFLLILMLAVSVLALGGDTLEYDQIVIELDNGDTLFSNLHYHPLKDSVQSIINGRLGDVNLAGDANINPSKIDSTKTFNINKITTETITGDTIKASGANGLTLHDDGGNGIFIDDGGYVGLGTVSPTTAINISGGSDANTAISIDRTDLSTTCKYGYNYIGTVTTGDANSNFNIYSGGTIRITVDQATGNVGINEASPTRKLDVAGSINADDSVITTTLVADTVITTTLVQSKIDLDSLSFGDDYLKTFISSSFQCTLKTASIGSYIDHTTAYYTKIGDLVSVTMETMTGSHTAGSAVAMALTGLPSELRSPRAAPYAVICPVVSNSANESGKIEIYNDGTADLVGPDGLEFGTGTGGIGHAAVGVGYGGSRWVNFTYSTY